VPVLRNHASIQANPRAAEQKISKEVALGRVKGPFAAPPLPHFIVSPLGLVPKRDPGQFRLIHDLSYPRGDSVNSHIPRYESTVECELLDHCVELLFGLGRGALMAKADLKDAFRILPIHPLDHHLLGFSYKGELYYDLCLPMGCSVSCALFESFSQALQWICSARLAIPHMSHILDKVMCEHGTICQRIYELE